MLEYYDNEITRLGVRLRVGFRANRTDLLNFDEIVLATGVNPKNTNIPGQKFSKNVISYQDVFENKVKIGKKVAIVGAGGIGFDVAEYLSSKGKSPTLDLHKWLREWGVVDPELQRGGLSQEIESEDITLANED